MSAGTGYAQGVSGCCSLSAARFLSGAISSVSRTFSFSFPLTNRLVSYYTINPAASKNRCPTDVFVAATARTFKGTGELEDGTVALEDVICVLSSLIDQSLIRGQLAYSSTSLVLKPSPDGVSGGFPPLASVTPRRVEAIV